MIFLKLTLTGVLLFLLSFLAAQVDAPRTATWWEVLVAIVFVMALLLFFVGGFGVVWVLLP